MMKRKTNQTINGFTMAEALLGLLICSICALILSMEAVALRSMIASRTPLQEEFAVLQLRELATLASSVEVEDGVLILDQGRKEERIEQDGKRLVKRPGYEILMEPIERAFFIQKTDEVILVFQTGLKEERVSIVQNRE